MPRRLPRLVRAVATRLIPAGDLTTRTVRSGAWEFAINLSSRVLQLIVLIVLANLLTPRDFGLMGIALLVIAGFSRFSRLGIKQALIHHEDEDIDEYLDTVFGIGIGRGLVIAGLTLVSATFVGAIFGEPRVVPILHVLAISPVLLGFRNPGIVYFEKGLQFHRKFAYRISGSLVEFAVAIGWAFVYRDVWALVLGYVAADATRTVVSYLIHPYRPRPALDTAKAIELLQYGKWITANNVVSFTLNEGDDAVVGALLGATALGFYKYAYRIGNAPATEISKVIGDVMFSSFSKLQDKTEALGTAFVRTVRLTSVVAVPTAIGIVVVAPVFVRGFLGEEWVPMVRVMQILSLYGLLLSVMTVFHQLWKAVGRPDIVTKLELIRLGLLALLILPAVQFGIEGVAVAVVGVYAVVSVPTNLYLLPRAAGVAPGRLTMEVAYPLVAGALMGGVVLGARTALDLPPVVEFLTLVPLGIVTYVPVAILLDSTFDWGLMGNLRTIIGTFQG